MINSAHIIRSKKYTTYKQNQIQNNSNKSNNNFKAIQEEQLEVNVERKDEELEEEEAAAKGPSNGFMTTTITHEQS